MDEKVNFRYAGDEFELGTYDVTREEIIGFSRKYDPFSFHRQPPDHGETLIKDRIQRLFQVPSSETRVNPSISKKFIWEHIHQVTNDVKKR